MTRNPLISCIIIFYNANERFFVEAIESVLAQSYANWELLLVDDGSTDRSSGIAKQYTEKYPGRIWYLEHQGHRNRGMSATRNLGISRARGQYLGFLDADDVWLPHALKEQEAILDRHREAAMVYGPVQWWYSWAENAMQNQVDFLDMPVVPMPAQGVVGNSVVQPPVLFVQLLRGAICISGMLLRRDAVARVGGFEQRFTDLYEDQVFCSKVCLNYPVYVSSTTWYRYRQHGQSCVGSNSKHAEHLARGAFLHWLEDYLTREGCTHKQAWTVLRRELLRHRWPATANALATTSRWLDMSKLRRRLKRAVERRLAFRHPPHGTEE